MASALRVQVSPSAFMYSGLTAMKKETVAVVIISNGPGELTTWVNPVVDEINKINKSLCDAVSYTHLTLPTIELV